MKPSRYNYFFRVDDQVVLAYNTLTTALLELSADEYNLIESCFLHHNKDLLESKGMSCLEDQLVEAGILVPDDHDELRKIRLLHSELKKHDRSFGLTIVPTLNCNFRCSYCFSYASDSTMTSKTTRSLMRFIDGKLAVCDSFSLSWFGGEPTLCIDTIEEISTELFSLCARHHVSTQPGTIVTNGYLLDESMAKRLKRAKISRAQVTIDGDRETHDRRRPACGGQGTFDRILDNVQAVSDTIEIQIRINVNRNNVESAIGALDALESRKLRGKVHIHFGHVKEFTEACSDVGGACLSNKEFSEVTLQLTREALARGFGSFPYPRLQIGGVCGADKQLNYVVGPDGLLFKCWAEASLGMGASVGSVFNGDTTRGQEDNLKGFLSWDPLAPPQCQECRILPLCMGGCPHLGLRQEKREDCSNWRYSLLETLAMRYKLRCQV